MHSVSLSSSIYISGCDAQQQHSKMGVPSLCKYSTVTQSTRALKSTRAFSVHVQHYDTKPTPCTEKQLSIFYPFSAGRLGCLHRELSGASGGGLGSGFHFLRYAGLLQCTRELRFGFRSARWRLLPTYGVLWPSLMHA